MAIDTTKGNVSCVRIGLTNATGAASLPPRQLDCLRGIAAGQTTREIAEALGLSRFTVDHYIGLACVRLQARSRAHAVALAIGSGILKIGSPEL